MGRYPAIDGVAAALGRTASCRAKAIAGFLHDCAVTQDRPETTAPAIRTE